MKTHESATIGDCVRWAEHQLAAADVHFGHGCDNAADEAIWAALHVSGLIHLEYESVRREQVTRKTAKKIRRLIKSRIQTRKPLAYLIREAWFAQLPFYVDDRAIVPRSHIGDLIEDGFSPWVSEKRVGAVLDLCTGSGCIAVALALRFPQAAVDAADIDSNALEVARINIGYHDCDGRIRLVESNLFENIEDKRYDLIVSNPPYVNENELPDLPHEYRYEPQIALTGGDDGLDIVRRILAQCSDYLSPHGHLVMELGDSAQTLENAFPDVPFLWLTSKSGQSVVTLLSADTIKQFRGEFDSP